MQINVVRNEDARTIAEKIMACNYEPEKNPTHTEKQWKIERIAQVIFFPRDGMKNISTSNCTLIFQPTYLMVKSEIDKITSPFDKIRKTRCRR